MIMSEMFQTYNGSIPSKDSFMQRVSSVREHGLYTPGEKILKEIVEVLQQRREVLDAISKVEERAGGRNKKTGLFFRAQVTELLPPGFLSEISCSELPHLSRYLKAIAIRMERRMTNPAKDAAKEKQLVPHVQRYFEAIQLNNISSDLMQELTLYKKMIEEFKVSLFAQELKTAFPVSARRLEEKWREIKLLSIR